MKYFTLYIMLLSTLLSGCSDMEDDIKGSVDSMVTATFTLQLPGQTTPSTRSISVTNENYLETVDVLVFKQNTDGNEYLACKVAAKALDNNNTTSKKFTISLQKSDKLHRFVFIANARNQVNALNLTDTIQTKEQITQQLLFQNTNKWNSASQADFTPLPMWGESGLYPITNSTNNIPGIKLLRMLARIDIQVGENTNFALQEVYIYNRNSVGRIVPEAAALNISGMVVTQPSLPASPNPLSDPLLYTTTSGSFIRDIYLFEALARENRDEATCLIIGGNYMGGAKTYYRVDFSDNNQPYSDILRNHLYSITITDVSGNGHLTPGHAFASETQHITTDIFVWDEGGLNHIAFNNEYLLGVNDSEFTLRPSAYATDNEENTLTIGTNYPNGWRIENIVDSTGTPITHWLKVSQSASSSAGKTNVSLILEENFSSLVRTGYIYIQAGNLHTELRVNQEGR